MPDWMSIRNWSSRSIVHSVRFCALHTVTQSSNEVNSNRLVLSAPVLANPFLVDSASAHTHSPTASSVQSVVVAIFFFVASRSSLTFAKRLQRAFLYIKLETGRYHWCTGLCNPVLCNSRLGNQANQSNGRMAIILQCAVYVIAGRLKNSSIAIA